MYMFIMYNKLIPEKSKLKKQQITVNSKDLLLPRKEMVLLSFTRGFREIAYTIRNPSAIFILIEF